MFQSCGLQPCGTRSRSEPEDIKPLKTGAANGLNAAYSVEIPPTPLDKGGGNRRGDLQRHSR